jgi:hypothetical protein
MAALKNRKTAVTSSRKNRASKSKNGRLVLGFFVFLFVLAGVIGIFYFFSQKRDGNKFFNGENFQQESLIRGDEQLYRNHQNNFDNGVFQSGDNAVERKGRIIKEKANFKAPEYGERDKNYLDKLIKNK